MILCNETFLFFKLINSTRRDVCPLPVPTIYIHTLEFSVIPISLSTSYCFSISKTYYNPEQDE